MDGASLANVESRRSLQHALRCPTRMSEAAPLFLRPPIGRDACTFLLPARTP